jgi:S1-C subfamily serine protease
MSDIENNHDTSSRDQHPDWVLVASAQPPSAPERSMGDTDEIPTAGGFTPPPFEARSVRTTKASRKGIVSTIAAVAAAAFLGAGVGHVAWPSSPTGTHSAALATPSSPVQPPGGSDPRAFGGSGPGSSRGAEGTSSSAQVANVAAQVSPSLVDINTKLGYQSAQAAGTGIVLSSDGIILTNNHVIRGATEITATDVGNHKTYNATVVGYDRSHDIAVIKLVGASGLTTAPIGSSRGVSVGQAVIGIGNAGGLGGTPSFASGTVTALHQSITASDSSGSDSEELVDLIETNAPIQPGDSGGPLVSLDGRVIGVDTAASDGYSFSTGAAQGFAVPIDTAVAIAKQINGGHGSSTIHIGQTPFLGLEIQPDSSTSVFSNPIGGQASGADPTALSGASVGGVLSGSPAEKAGITEGDTITAVNGSRVATAKELTNQLSRFHPGDTVRVDWVDANGVDRSGRVTLVVGPVG